MNGFGRYLRADEISRRLLDINFFSCQVVVEDPTDIPENIFLTVGEYIVSVLVVLVSTAPFGGDDRGVPFADGDPNEGGIKPTAWGVNLPDGPIRRMAV